MHCLLWQSRILPNRLEDHNRRVDFRALVLKLGDVRVKSLRIPSKAGDEFNRTGIERFFRECDRPCYSTPTRDPGRRCLRLAASLNMGL